MTMTMTTIDDTFEFFAKIGRGNMRLSLVSSSPSAVLVRVQAGTRRRRGV
jgi:hypothetical protein